MKIEKLTPEQTALMNARIRNMTVDTIREVALSKIRYPGNWEKIKEDPVVAVLVASIAENGLIVPIVLNPDLSFVAGRKRTAAFEKLNWPKIPAIVRDYPTDTSNRPKKAELAENLHRHHMDKAERDAGLAAYAKLLKGSGWGKKTTEKVAKAAKVSKRTVERAVENAEKTDEAPSLPADFNTFGLTLEADEIEYVNNTIATYKETVATLKLAARRLGVLAMEPAKIQRLSRELRAIINDIEVPIALCPSCKMFGDVLKDCTVCFSVGLAGKSALARASTELLATGKHLKYRDADGELQKVKS